jgi:hypothetical protein
MINRLNKHAIYWTLQTGVWSSYALLHILLAFIDNPENIQIRIISIIFTAGYFLLSTHIYRNIVLKLGWLDRKLLSLIPRVLLSAFILAITWFIFEMGLSFVLKTMNSEQDFQTFRVIAIVMATMPWYLLWASVYFLYHYVEKTNASLKYEAAIYEIELNQLKSQLNPHFIFNALNSIRALVDEDPIKSKTAITQLSNILRNSLIINRRKLVELKDELKTVRDYLALESIRFEERLTVKFDIDPMAESYQVPPLMIQTLVENGIKHGISKLTQGGFIAISVRLGDKEQLIIEIRNSGQLPDQPQKGTTGYGLENTLRRLDLLFGSRSSFFIGNEDNKTVVTRITLPQSVIYESVDH